MTFSAATGGRIESYTATLYEDDNDATTACEAGTEVDLDGDGTNGVDGSQTAATSPIVFTDRDDDTYCVVVVANTESGGSSDESASAAVTVDAVPNDTTAPTSVDSVVTSDILAGDAAVATDVWKIAFSEDMDAIAGGEVIRLTDSDGTVADVVCGTNADCTLNGSAETVNGVSYEDARVLTVTLTGAPTTVTAGTVAGLQYPATVADSSGITDLSGNGWNEAGSADRVIDEEA